MLTYGGEKGRTYLSFTPSFIAYFLSQVWVVGDQEVIEDSTRLDLRWTGLFYINQTEKSNKRQHKNRQVFTPFTCHKSSPITPTLLYL